MARLMILIAVLVCIFGSSESSNGDVDACVSRKCKQGEGDCDSNEECHEGLVCSHNVGSKYGFGPDIDVCEDPSEPPPSDNCTEIDCDHQINFWFQESNYPPNTTACWKLLCRGVLSALDFDMGDGDYLTIGPESFGNFRRPDKAAFFEGDIMRFTSDSQWSEGRGFLLDLTCNVPCETLSDGGVVDFMVTPDTNLEGIDECWVATCSKSGMLHIKMLSGNGSLTVRDKWVSRYQGSSGLHSLAFRGNVYLRFEADTNHGAAFFIELQCFDTCTGAAGDNGGLDVCANCKCEEGEGDCDSEEECAAGLTCSHNVGRRYGLGWDVDVCEKPGMGGEDPDGCATVNSTGMVNMLYDESGYPPNTEACWLLDCRGVLKALRFSLGDGDYLSIGGHPNFTRSKPPLHEVYFAKGDAVRFNSDSSSEGNGFLLRVTCEPPTSAAPTSLVPLTRAPPTSPPSTRAPSTPKPPRPPSCNDVDLQKNFYVLEHLHYDNDEALCWVADCVAGGWVVFDVFSTEEGHDWLQVGPKRYSGDLLPGRRAFKRLRLQFTSDGNVKGGGFRATFICAHPSLFPPPDDLPDVPTTCPKYRPHAACGRCWKDEKKAIKAGCDGSCPVATPYKRCGKCWVSRSAANMNCRPKKKKKSGGGKGKKGSGKDSFDWTKAVKFLLGS